MNLLLILLLTQTLDERVDSLEAVHGLELCGDAVVNAGAGETCDDGNLLAGDGCDATCQVEPPPPPPPPPSGGGLVDSVWTQIPGSAMDSVFVPGVDDRPPKYQYGWQHIQDAWNGAVCVANELWLWGGGHNDSDRNMLLKVDPQTGVWTRVTEPSPIWRIDDGVAPLEPEECVDNECVTPYGVCPWDDCPVNPDGTPVSRHTYYLLASDGDYIYAGSTALWRLGRGTGEAAVPAPRWLKYEIATGAWSPMASESTLNNWGSILLVGGKLYHTIASGFDAYDLASGTWSSPGVNLGRNGFTGLVYAPTSDRIFLLGGGVAEYVAPSAWGQVPMAIQSPPAAISLKSPGLAYYPPEDLVLFWQGGPTITTLNATTLEWGSVTPGGGDPGAAIAAGTFGRFSYCGGRVLLVNGVSQDMWYLEIP